MGWGLGGGGGGPGEGVGGVRGEGVRASLEVRVLEPAPARRGGGRSGGARAEGAERGGGAA